MAITLRILVGILVADLVLIGGWAIWRLYHGVATSSPLELGPAIVSAGVLVALISLLRTHDRDASEDHLEGASDLIEKAHSVLNDEDSSTGQPKNNRINWLTSARLLKQADAVARGISDGGHKAIWREKKEYWRGQFHDLIYPDAEGFPPSYYAEKPEHLFTWGDDDRPPLSLKSLAVLYRFVRWPEEHEDPLASDEPFTDLEIDRMAQFGPRGLGKLLEKYRDIKASKSG